MTECARRTLAFRVFAASLTVVFTSLLSTPAPAGSQPSEETWQEIKPDLFEDAQIGDGTGMLSIEAPKRAHDAAVVPISIKARKGADIRKITLVIDENPAPLAGGFEFGPAAASVSFSTRVRVNSYSYIRAVAETADGRLHMVKTFVKASGGCSAPANKDMDKAMAQIGRMKLRLFADKTTSVAGNQSGVREGQIMIRHPNYSGFQMNQITMLYIPPHFVDSIEIRHDDRLVMRVEGGISLSEDPNIRFYYKGSGTGRINVTATDTEEGTFARSWPMTGS